MEKKTNKLRKFNQPYIGLIIGILLPMIVFLGYYGYLLSQDSSLVLIDFIETLIINDTFTPIVTVCVLPNVILFFILKKIDFWYAMKGLIGSVVFYVFIVILTKII